MFETNALNSTTYFNEIDSSSDVYRCFLEWNTHQVGLFTLSCTIYASIYSIEDWFVCVFKRYFSVSLAVSILCNCLRSFTENSSHIHIIYVYK